MPAKTGYITIPSSGFHYDDVFHFIGEFDAYQIFIIILLGLCHFTHALFATSSVFIEAIPWHRCAIPDYQNDTYFIQDTAHERLVNASIPFYINHEHRRKPERCHMYDLTNSTLGPGGVPVNATRRRCDRWVYDKSVLSSTITEELNLVCNDKLGTVHSQMVFMSGVLIGSLVFGAAADKIGRKLTICICVLVLLISGLGVAWSVNFTMFCVLRFIVGASDAGLAITSFVLCVELVGRSKRTLSGMIIMYFFTIGQLVLDLLAYVIYDWRLLATIVAIPGALFLPYWWLVPESPRWLITKGRIPEAMDTLRMIANRNHRVLPVNELFADAARSIEGRQGSVRDIFTSRVMVCRSIVIFFNWFVCSMVYYGLALNSGNLAGNLYLNFALNAIVEIPAYLVCIKLLNKLGRKPIYVVSMLIAGLSCICTVFPVIYGDRRSQVITVILAMFGKLGTSASFAIIYVYSAELFPTVIRSGILGICSMFARLGAMVTPYVAESGVILGGQIGDMLPLLAFGCMAVIAGVSAILLPETLNRTLPETIADAINFNKLTVAERAPDDAIHTTTDIATQCPSPSDQSKLIDRDVDPMASHET